MVKHKCNYCQYESQHKWVVKRHMEFKHVNKAPRAPSTLVSAAACESRAPSPIQMVVPEIRPPAINQVYHPDPDQRQRYNNKRLRSSEESTDKFDRFHQALHRKTCSVNQSQEGNYPRKIANKVANVNNKFSLKWRKLLYKKNLSDSIGKIISKYLNIEV